MKPPATRIDPVAETLHGTLIIDNYRWLEGDNRRPDQMGRVTDEVSAWTDAQNTHTRTQLDAIPGRAGVEQALRPLMEVGSVTAPVVHGGRWFFSRREGTQSQPVFYWRESADGRDRVLLDPALLDPTGLTTIEWISPSHDGRRLAYGIYRAGDENTNLHVIDVDSGGALDVRIPNKVQSPFWLPDGTGFVYRNLCDPEDPYSGRVRFHRIGTTVADDPVLHAQLTRDEDAVLATTWGPTGTLSADGRWLLLGYWIDTQSRDAWLVDLDQFLSGGPLEKRVVSVGLTGGVDGTVIASTLYLHTTKNAPRGRLVRVAAADPGITHWRDVVPERSDAVMESVAFGQGVVAVTFMQNASNYVEVFDLQGGSLGRITQPGIGAVAVTAGEDRTTAYLTFTSFNYPTTVFEVDLRRPTGAAAVWACPAVPVDPASVVVEQVWYPSKDGTSISMFLIHRADVAPNGQLPTIVTGYGGFNISETPVFIPSWFQWFDVGGMIAVPNLRGGGEYGDAWHQAGMLEKKQNVFDDFHAALMWLTQSGYTNPEKIAISGGSNGGLLTGATITQHPHACRAAIVAVPLLDMLRYQHFLMARYWVPEYGSSENAQQFAFLRDYSPYHHVHPGTPYPGVLLTAGENDTRVHAMHARKMAAALQAATGSDAETRPVLLWVDRESGHGQGKPLHLRLRDAVDQRGFLMWQLGLLPPNK